MSGFNKYVAAVLRLCCGDLTSTRDAKNSNALGGWRSAEMLSTSFLLPVTKGV
jgi:hypothetical protein